MRYFYVVSHAHFASGIVSSVEMILGQQPNLSAYCAYVDDLGDQFLSVLTKQLDTRGPEDEIVILTDLFGGSVNNEILTLMRTHRVHIITGMNLMLVMSLVMGDENQPLEELIEESIEASREGMKYCNTMFSEQASLSDDDF